MEYIREVIDSSLLINIDLPESMQNTKVEIIIFPFDEKLKNKDILSIDSMVGILSQYKNSDLIKYEKDAWMNAMEEKYANN